MLFSDTIPIQIFQIVAGILAGGHLEKPLWDCRFWWCFMSFDHGYTPDRGCLDVITGQMFISPIPTVSKIYAFS